MIYFIKIKFGIIEFVNHHYSNQWAFGPIIQVFSFYHFSLIRREYATSYVSVYPSNIYSNSSPKSEKQMKKKTINFTKNNIHQKKKQFKKFLKLCTYFTGVFCFTWKKSEIYRKAPIVRNWIRWSILLGPRSTWKSRSRLIISSNLEKEIFIKKLTSSSTWVK